MSEYKNPPPLSPSLDEVPVRVGGQENNCLGVIRYPSLRATKRSKLKVSGVSDFSALKTASQRKNIQNNIEK